MITSLTSHTIIINFSSPKLPQFLAIRPAVSLYFHSWDNNKEREIIKIH